jgi:ADP-heptose:LPS heptosyltransferase
MTPNTIRIIDKWLGQPICLALTVVRKVFPARKTKDKGPILFIKLIEQGATVLAYSAIQRAVKMVGRENVYFCVFADNKPILDILDVVPEKNIFSIRQGNFLHFLVDILRLLIKSRRVGIRSTVDMEFFSRASAILAYLSGAKNRVGLHRFNSEQPYRGDLLTHRVQYNPYLHTAKAYLLLVKALEADLQQRPMLKLPSSELEVKAPVFMPSDEEMEKVKKLVEEKYGGRIPSSLVLLNPNASDMLPLRKWDTPNFVTLGKKILDAYPNSGLVLTGAPSEKANCKNILAAFNDPRVVAVAGETTLRELLVLYTLSSLLVTNDSGPGHFASMTTMPALVLFGPETPELFSPIGDRIEVIWKGLACSPCVNPFNHRFSPCDNNLCMQHISVDEVFEKVQDMLPSGVS